VDKLINKMSERELRAEVKHLRHKVVSLENGACRFHCRMRKDMWKAGFRWCMKYFYSVVGEMPDCDVEKQYNIWRANDGTNK